MSRLIDNYLGGMEVRRTVFNWPEQIKGIVDGYRVHTSIPHAVQKDAIQNGWSARKDRRRGKNWGFLFELIEAGGRKFLSMTDTGTTGLTGRVLSPEEYERDLPSEEKWGRFEGVAFTQPRTERALGSRGRGKFIFVGASKEHTILYDTLRENGTYRYGFRTVIRTESPVAAYDGQEGKQKLGDMTGGLVQPLSHVGARVIIVNPVDEVIESIRDGSFLRFIGETWWEIILKYGPRIIVRQKGGEDIAQLPAEFRLEERDSKNFKVWAKDNQKLGIKRLHMIYDATEAMPEDIRGIALQRDGMKICSISPRYLGREIAERLYGYITFDDNTEESLVMDEGPEHYSYDFRRSLPWAIRRYVEDEMQTFAREKLGWGREVDAREVRRQQQRNAERRALIAVNRFARELGIGAALGGRTGGGGGGGKPRDIHIQMDDLMLPRAGDLRVNYGETVGNIRARIVNKSAGQIVVRFKLLLAFYDKPIKTYAEEDVSIPPQSLSDYWGPFDQTFSEEQFPDSGRHTIRAKIVSLRDEDKGKELDVETKSFYLEEDPPERGLFERCEPLEFPERAKMIMAESRSGDRDGLVLEYNVNHPAQEAVQDYENDLAAYLVWLMGHEMCRYDLGREQPILFEGAEKDDPDAILRKTLRKIGEFLHRFRVGEIA